MKSLRVVSIVIMVSGIRATARAEPEFVRPTTIKVGGQEVSGFFVTSETFRKLDRAATATTSYVLELAERKTQISKLEEANAELKKSIRATEEERDKFREAWLKAELLTVEASKCSVGGSLGWVGLGFVGGLGTCIGAAYSLPR